jgi:hypothetical protein
VEALGAGLRLEDSRIVAGRQPISRDLSIDEVSGHLLPFSCWCRSDVICCQVAGLPAATKPMGYLVLDYPSFAGLAWYPHSPGFIRLDCVKLSVDLTWKAISRCVL